MNNEFKNQVHEKIQKNEKKIQDRFATLEAEM